MDYMPSPNQGYVSAREGLLTNNSQASALAMAWACWQNYPTLLDLGPTGIYLPLDCSISL
jgi:hypothetical protein